MAAYNEDVSVCPGFREFWITVASQKQLLMMTDLQGEGVFLLRVLCAESPPRF